MRQLEIKILLLSMETRENSKLNLRVLIIDKKVEVSKETTRWRRVVFIRWRSIIEFKIGWKNLLS